MRGVSARLRPGEAWQGESSQRFGTIEVRLMVTERRETPGVLDGTWRGRTPVRPPPVASFGVCSVREPATPASILPLKMSSRLLSCVVAERHFKYDKKNMYIEKGNMNMHAFKTPSRRPTNKAKKRGQTQKHFHYIKLKKSTSIIHSEFLAAASQGSRQSHGRLLSLPARHLAPRRPP